jgi:hypothetical protein
MMVDSQTPFPHRRNEEGLYDSICPTLPASFIRCSKNLASIDFNILLTEVMTIADEIDSQLSRAMASYVSQTTGGALPACVQIRCVREESHLKRTISVMRIQPRKANGL